MMENKYFPLGPTDSSRFIKLIQVAFGFVCIVIAGFWLAYNIKSLKADSTLWITILFLSGFGFYMVWAGLGKASRFIEVGSENLRIKKTIFLPVNEMLAGDIKKIEVFPFKICITLKTEEKLTLRLSNSYHETNGEIIEAILVFAEVNSIEIEEIDEKIL